MAEVTLRSYDPFAYYVNNVSDLDPEVVKAYKKNDQERTRELLSRAKSDFDVFICVNAHSHAFVLCVPVGPVETESPLVGSISKEPSDIPELQLCWRFELCFENEQLKMYKIRKGFSVFKDIVGKIHKSYYVGVYRDMAASALQFAVLRSAPHRYNALLDDCVEFAKEFCRSLLSYCSNWKTLEKQVNDRIKEASATGLSIEKLSRKYRKSGVLGNLSLRGAETSFFLTDRRGAWLVVGLLLIYPVVVAVIVVLLLK